MREKLDLFKNNVFCLSPIFKNNIKAHNLANDGTDEDELDAQMMSAVSEFDSKKSWGVFRPDSTGHMAWTLLGFIITVEVLISLYS